jgi:hypothetical protein
VFAHANDLPVVRLNQGADRDIDRRIEQCMVCRPSPAARHGDRDDLPALVRSGKRRAAVGAEAMGRDGSAPHCPWSPPSHGC